MSVISDLINSLPVDPNATITKRCNLSGVVKFGGDGMRKDKEWLKKELAVDIDNAFWRTGMPIEISLELKIRANALIDQLKEPSKPVIPQFVADWYESYKDNTLAGLLDDVVHGHSEEVKSFRRWFHDSGREGNYSNFIARVWLDGYEVDSKFEVKQGDWVIGRGNHSHDIRIVEGCDIDGDIDENGEVGGILLVNGIKDEYYLTSELEQFYKKYRLFVKKENVEVN